MPYGLWTSFGTINNNNTYIHTYIHTYILFFYSSKIEVIF
jgi:hypothetical protein